MPLAVTIPPIFDMGEGLKECEGDLFAIRIFFNREATIYPT